MTKVLARFETAAALLAATAAAREAGYRQMDAFAPFPVPGLADALGYRERWIAPLALMAGLVAAALAYALQWYSAVVDYPWVVGGKPLHSGPAFMLVTVSVGILAAAITALVAMLAGNGLPRPHHPVFDWDVFDRASGDGFFLLIEGEDEEATARFMKDNEAVELTEIQTGSTST